MDIKNRIKLMLLVLIFFAFSCEKNEPTDTNNDNNNNGTPTITKSSAKDITKFSFAALSPAVDATIDAANKSISATVPATTDLTKLVPTIYDINITLNAGVAIEFGTDAGFMASGKGTLTASGTATDPVKLTGYTSGKGIWAGILFDSNKPENKLNYCVIDGAGSTSMSTTNFNSDYEKNAKAAIVFDGTNYKGSYRGTVTNCTISNSGGYGIAYSVYSKDDVTVSGNTFNNNTKDNVVVFSY